MKTTVLDEPDLQDRIPTDRQTAFRHILDTMMGVHGVLSANILGSFVEKADISTISDLDVVVICRKVTRSVFENCIRAAEGLDPSIFGFPGRTIRVNPTFGPLKFDTSGIAVVHLMIYDIAGHRDHALRSPFTCLDWERSPVHSGPSLSQLYPVLRLQPRDFTGARRGMNDYISDLEQGAITYRKYAFDGDAVKQTLDRMPLDRRHKGEYAFHIMRNTIVNYIKLMTGENLLPGDEELTDKWRELLPSCAEFIPQFRELRRIKSARNINFPEDTVSLTKQFLIKFHDAFAETWDRCPRLTFIRHAPTLLNDGSFLGVARDPHISPDVKISAIEDKFDMVITSPLKRAVETGKLLAPAQSADIDPRLSEIDYGKAEGLTLTGLSGNFPDIVDAWKRGEDPRFPDGENSSDVLERMMSFLSDPKLKKNNILVVTHNVVLRSIVGHLYGIPMQQWHKLRIPHLAPIEVLVRNGKPYINASMEIKSVLTDSLVDFEPQSVR